MGNSVAGLHLMLGVALIPRGLIHPVGDGKTLMNSKEKIADSWRIEADSLITLAKKCCLSLSLGQTIATCQRNISQHCWAQHVACSLATVLRCVATCWVLLAQVLELVKYEPTTPNMSQHVGQTHATCCAQQCCDMLCWHVAIVWPGL